MADNIQVTAGTGTNIATDDVGGAHYQRIKVVRGVDGSVKGDVGTFGSTVSLLSTELNSLASSSTVGYASAEVDLTSEGCDDVSVLGAFQMTTAGSPTGYIDVYAIWSHDGTVYTGDTNYSGTAASYTLGAASSPNLTWLASAKAHANTGTYRCGASLKASLGFGPAFFAIVVVNNSGIALHTSGSTVTYRARY